MTSTKAELRAQTRRRAKHGSEIVSLTLDVEHYREIADRCSGDIGYAIIGLISAVKDLEAALKEIASGDGVYGAQAFEYKTIARKALGLMPIGAKP